MSKKGKNTNNNIAENRKARYNYTLLDEYEAGIVLKGSEVKSLRNSSANIAESFVEIQNNELWLINCYINEYVNASNKHFSHYTRRQRKLLLNKREIKRLVGAVQRKGLTIVPIRMYFNDDGRVKLKISLAQGKAKHDKRESEKNRDWQRQKQRLLKER